LPHSRAGCMLRPVWRARDGDEGGAGPASIYCDLCRDEVKREQAALRAQANRQRKASYGGCDQRPPRPGCGFRRGTQ